MAAKRKSKRTAVGRKRKGGRASPKTAAGTPVVPGRRKQTPTGKLSYTVLSDYPRKK